jgi:integrase
LPFVFSPAARLAALASRRPLSLVPASRSAGRFAAVGGSAGLRNMQHDVIVCYLFFWYTKKMHQKYRGAIFDGNYEQIGGDTGIKRPGTITEAQAEKILLFLPGPYDRLIWRVALETGARINDILLLTRREARRQPLTLWEHKSKRQRTITLSEQLHSDISRWVNRDSDYPAFHAARDTRRPLNRATFYRRLQRAAKMTHPPIHVSAHSARKLYAMRIFKRTGDIFEVQKALHHKYVTTTATYLDINLIDLLSAHNPT